MGNYGSGFGFYRGGGAGSGTITGAGTSPRIPKFTGASTLADSQMADDGTTVYVGASATSASALFEIASTTQGFLPPRMTTVERDAIATPAAALFIYNTDTNLYNFYNGTSWGTVDTDTQSLTQVLSVGNTTGGTNISMTSGDTLDFNVGSGGSLNSLTTTAARTWSLPDLTGTIALTSQLTGNGIFDAANDGSSIPSSFSADLTDNFEIGDANNYTRFVKTEDMVVFTDTTTYKGYQAINNTNALDVRIDMVANRFGKGVVRNTHPLTFEMSWNGLPSSGGIELMRLNTNQTVSIGTTAQTSKLSLRGSGATNATTALLIENSAGSDRFIFKDDGQHAHGIGGQNAVANANIGSYNTVQNYTTGFGFYSFTGVTTTSKSVHNGGGANPIAVEGNFTGSPTGTATALKGISYQATPNVNYGVHGLGRNGVQRSVGVFGQIAGGATTTSSQYVAGVEGSAGTNVDALSYGGRFTAQYANASLNYTVDMIGVYGSATVGTNGGGGSSNVAIGGQFLTSNAGGGATTTNMAINVPSTGNNGVVVFGADARNGDSVLQVTGDIEVLGSANGLILEAPDTTRYRVTVTNAGVLDTNAA